MESRDSSVDRIHFQIGVLYEMYRQIASGIGLSESSFWVLYFLAKSKEAVSQSKMAIELSLPKQTINSSIKCLVQKHLLTLGALPHTNRTKSVQLTECGRAFVEKNIIPLQQAERYALLAAGGMEDTFTQLRQALKQFV